MSRLDNITMELARQLYKLEQVGRELEHAESRMKHHRPNIDADPWALNFYLGACSRTTELIDETIAIQGRISQLETQLRDLAYERNRMFKAKLEDMPRIEIIEL